MPSKKTVADFGYFPEAVPEGLHPLYDRCLEIAHVIAGFTASPEQDCALERLFEARTNAVAAFHQ